jgi:HAD superfamily hydrolase (TIGR01459 family)
MTEALPQLIDSLDDIAGRYAAVFCDVWGVVHNGVAAYPGAAEALRRARRGGAAVVLVTNAARHHHEVAAQLRTIGVPDDAWDRIVTSGDVTRALIRAAPRRIFHLGQDRALTLLEGLDVELVAAGDAEAVVCTGLLDDADTPEIYRPLLEGFRGRELPFICANPDIFFERGDRRIWCAGALARDYQALGGPVRVAGKPHPPIYEASLAAASEVKGRTIRPAETLAIGDGVLTDVAGACRQGIDVLYVSGGIHASEYAGSLGTDGARLAAFLQGHDVEPVAVIPELR